MVFITQSHLPIWKIYEVDFQKHLAKVSYLHKKLVHIHLLVAHEAKKLMPEGGSIVATTYIGGEAAVQNYNVMGVKASLEANVKYLALDLGEDNIRVNAISAGPIRTLSAKGVGGFNTILKEIEARAPLKRNVDQEEVGKTAAYLLSDLQVV